MTTAAGTAAELSAPSARAAAGGKASRWRSPEFLFYIGLIGFLVLYSIPVLNRELSAACAGSPECQRHLEDGWFGYKVRALKGEKAPGRVSARRVCGGGCVTGS